MKLRITGDGTPNGTRIFDATTDAEFLDVAIITLVIDAESGRSFANLGRYASWPPELDTPLYFTTHSCEAIQIGPAAESDHAATP